MRIVNIGVNVVSAYIHGVRQQFDPGGYLDLPDEDYDAVIDEVKKIDDLEIFYIGRDVSYGKATLAGGNATVLTSQILSTSVVQLTAALTTINGKLHYDTVIPGVSFNIHTGNGGDNGIIDWVILN